MGTDTGRPGQVMPMVALMLVVIIGMAAFAIDGSNIYSQHRRMQADLDVAVRVAGAKMFDYQPTSSIYTSTATAAIVSAADLLSGNGYGNRIAGSAYGSPAGVWSAVPGGGICASDAGLTLCTPPHGGPFQGRFDFVEGTLGRDVGGFFGGAVGLGRVHLNVSATSEHGGQSEIYAVVGLDNNAQDCSISVQNTAATLGVYGSIHANGQTCIKNGTAVISGTAESVVDTSGSNGTAITGTNTVTTASWIANPYSVTVPLPTQAAVTMCASGCTYTGFADNSLYLKLGNGNVTAGARAAALCLTNLQMAAASPPSGVTYYLPPDLNAPAVVAPYSSTVGHAAFVDGFSASTGEFDFLPHCDSAQTPAAYDFGSSQPNPSFDIKVSGTATINSYNSVFVLSNTSSTSGNAVNNLIDASGSTNGSTSGVKWVIKAPTSGPFQGIALYQDQPCTVTSPPIGATLVGGANSLVNGVVDLACANLTVSGDSHDNPFVNGELVAWQVSIAGNGAAIVNFDPSGVPPDKGSVLVK